MCMQDLMIARNITWRQVTNAVTADANMTRIPRSPGRVALVVTTSADGNPKVSVRLTNSNTGPIVNAGYQQGVGPLVVSPMTIHTVPGMATMDLFADGTAATLTIWEAIQDSPLGEAVTRLTEELVEVTREH